MEDTTILSGQVSNKRRKDELIQIGETLGVPEFDKTANKDILVAKIKKYMRENQELIANEPRFQGLVAYRPGSVGTKKRGRTSADKNSEDAVEAGKKDMLPTGYAVLNMMTVFC